MVEKISKKKKKIEDFSSTILEFIPLIASLGIMGAMMGLILGGKNMDIKEIMSALLTHFEERMDELKGDIRILKANKEELTNEKEELQTKLEETQRELEEEKGKKIRKRKR